MSKFALTTAFVEVSSEKAVRKALCEANVRGATWVYGHGTCSNKLLCFLGLDSLRRAMMLVVHTREGGERLRSALNRCLQLQKHGHGIVYTCPIAELRGLAGTENDIIEEEKQVDQQELIVVIVNNGLGEEVVDAAEKGGATGATVLHGRGSGAEQKEHFFNFTIEPEKELVLLVADTANSRAIIDAIDRVVDFRAPNTGILFTMPITESIGLVKGRS